MRQNKDRGCRLRCSFRPSQWLVTAKAHRQPALLVEGTGRLNHAADDGRQGAAHLLRFNAAGQLPTQGHGCQKMKGAKTIGERAADGGIAAIGSDHAFLYGGVTLRARQNRRVRNGSQAFDCLDTVASTSSNIG